MDYLFGQTHDHLDEKMDYTRLVFCATETAFIWTGVTYNCLWQKQANFCAEFVQGKDAPNGIRKNQQKGTTRLLLRLTKLHYNSG